jgi:alpha-tubulin suppressor-like RCC1 family protein
MICDKVSGLNGRGCVQTPLNVSVGEPVSRFRQLVASVFSALLVIEQPAIIPAFGAAEAPPLAGMVSNPAQPLVWTDKADYAPGETVTVSGLDFAGGEMVSLQVTFADGRPAPGGSHQPWSVIADPTGVITGTWVVTPDCLGAMLLLTATGQTSARKASVLFTDATGVAPAPGDALAWGHGFYGQLGNGIFYTNLNRGTASPVAVSALPGGRKFAAVAARDFSSLALASDHTLWSWGRGNFGQLGNGSIANSATPVLVNSLPGNRSASAIANGISHQLVLATDGRMLGWGMGLYGQLGHGGWTDSAVPVLANELPLGRKAVAIASGAYHNLALADDGSMWAWGFGYYGSLGDGIFYTSSPNASAVPVAVNAIPGGRVVIAISAGNYHCLALASDGTVWAWGLGLYGCLGDGDFHFNAPNGRATPAQVNALPGGRTVVAISAGGYHNLVLANDGTLWTWGAGNVGQLGNANLADSAVPVPVNLLPGGRVPVKISAGTSHNLVLASDNSLWAWGQGNNGQLGNGGFLNSATPVAIAGVPAGEQVTAIAAGAHNLAILGSGNAAPSASAQSVSTLEDLPVIITLAGSDPEAQALTFTIVNNPSHGTLSLTPNLTYTPATNYHGPDSFTFTATDAGGTVSSPATVTIDVTPVNDAPNLASPGNRTISELSFLSFTITALDLENDAITYSMSAGAIPGMTLNAASGTFSWTPGEAHGPGTYQVTFRATDNGSSAKFDEETIVISVNEVNSAPVLSNPGDRSVGELNSLSFTLSATDADDPANVLAYSIQGGSAAGMSLNSSTGAFSWTPSEAQGPGIYDVTFRVTDQGSPALSHDQTIRLTIGEANLPPSLESPGNQTIVWGNQAAFTLTATDLDLPANTLIYSIQTGALPGMTITGNSFSWTPASDQLGTANVTIRVTDGGGLFAEQSIAIEVGRRATALVYDGSQLTQYSDRPLLSATLTDAGGGALHGSPIGNQVIGFTLGAQAASATTNPAGRAVAASAPMPAPTLAPQPPLPVACSFNDPNSAYLPASATATLAVVQEDTVVVYSGPAYFATAHSESDTATLALTGTATDANDFGRGDIRSAKMEFRRDAPDGELLGMADLAVGLVDASDPTVGIATTPTFPYTLSGSEQNAGGATLNVYTIVNGWYRGATGPDTITIAVPGADHVAAGGYLVLQNSAGEFAGDAGSKCSIGCTMKYNKGGKNLQGQVNLLIRRNGRVFQVRSNAIESLATWGEGFPKDASILTKANLTDITQPQNPVALGGNLTLQIEMTDQAQGGQSDQIAITLSSSSGGLLFSSHWDGSKTIRQTLGGGNVSVE